MKTKLDINVLNKLEKLLTKVLSTKIINKEGKLVPVFYLTQRFDDTDALFSKSVDEQVELLFPDKRKQTITSLLVGHGELRMCVNDDFVNDEFSLYMNGIFWDIQDGGYYFPNIADPDGFWFPRVTSIFRDSQTIKSLKKDIDNYNEWLYKLNKEKDPVSEYQIIWSSSLNRNRLDFNKLEKIFNSLYDTKNHSYYMVFTTYDNSSMDVFSYSPFPEYTLFDTYVLCWENKYYDEGFRLRKIGINPDTKEMKFFFAYKDKSEIVAQLYFEQAD